MEIKKTVSMTVLKDSNLIVQGNKLINARYKLGVQEGRFLYAAMSLIKPEDEDFKKYKINVSDLSRYLGILGGNMYKSLQGIAHNLISKSIVIESEEGWKEFPLLTLAQYEKSDNSITIQFHPEMKPFLLQQRQNFTQTKLQNLIKYGSSYTPRIYLFLREYLNFKRRDILIEDLKSKLDLDNYDYNDLKRRVLIPAQTEMKYHSDIRFEIVEHKQGKKVIKITFLIFANTPESLIEEGEGEAEVNSITAEVVDVKHEISKAFSKMLYKKYDVSLNVGLDLARDHANFAPAIFNYIDKKISQNNAIKNVAGFAVNVIKNKEYELLKDDDKEYNNFLTNLKIVKFDLLPEQQKYQIIREHDYDITQAITSINLGESRSEHLSYVLEINHSDLNRRSKKIRQKLEEEIEKIQQNEYSQFLNNLKKDIITTYGNHIFDKWFSSINIKKKAEDEITFCVDSKFNRDWIKREYLQHSDSGLLFLCKKFDSRIKKVTIIASER